MSRAYLFVGLIQGPSSFTVMDQPTSCLCFPSCLFVLVSLCLSVSLPNSVYAWWTSRALELTGPPSHVNRWPWKSVDPRWNM